MLFIDVLLGHGPYSHMFEDVINELRTDIRWKVRHFIVRDDRMNEQFLARVSFDSNVRLYD